MKEIGGIEMGGCDYFFFFFFVCVVLVYFIIIFIYYIFDIDKLTNWQIGKVNALMVIERSGKHVYYSSNMNITYPKTTNSQHYLTIM
jgi:hypothetical protein